MKAPACAGIIHTDFEKGFIRAEVMSYDDLIECGSELKVKEKVERLIMKANNRGGTDNISVAYLVREEGDIE